MHNDRSVGTRRNNELLSFLHTNCGWCLDHHILLFFGTFFAILSGTLRIIAVTEAIIVWGINRLLTKLRRPPRFHGSVLFQIVAEAPTEGVLLASIPAILTVAFIWLWFGEESFTASSDPVHNPSTINFEGITG